MEWSAQPRGLRQRHAPRNPGAGGSDSFIQAEIDAAVRTLSPVPVYFGLELIRQPGVIDVDPAHVVDMVKAGRAANAAGLVISWDLMHAPIDCVRALAETAHRGPRSAWRAISHNPRQPASFRRSPSHQRQRQKIGLGDVGIFSVEMLPSHFHRIVGLRIWILIDSAEDLAVVDQLPDILGIVANDERDLVPTIPHGIVHPADLGALQNDGVQLTLWKTTQEILDDRERLRVVEIIRHPGYFLVLRFLARNSTPDKVKRLKRWEHESVLDKMRARLDHTPEAMTIRRQTVENPFGTLKAWMGSTHFPTRTLEKVKTEMSLQVLAYNMKRMINIFGVNPLIQAIAA